MWPFENYNTFCPYLVGDYAEVAGQIGLYMRAGYRTFILDIPPSREELDHTRSVFEQARAVA
jgi:alkanesulfonate monooxygenase